MRALISIVLAGLCLTALPGCGQKGPLYLPGEQPPGKQPKPTQAAPQPAP